MEEKLRRANERLLIKDNSNEEKDRNLIFIYCPQKVGSTSLVSSLRLFACEKYTVLHIHNEEMLKKLYDIDVSINDLIQYNSSLGKNIYVIDIYRVPIEQKISVFFEKLEKIHFNNVVEKIRPPLAGSVRTLKNELLLSNANSLAGICDAGISVTADHPSDFNFSN